MEPTIRTHNLQRQYRMGDETIHALRGVDLTVQRGELRRDHGSLGFPGRSTLMKLDRLSRYSGRRRITWFERQARLVDERPRARTRPQTRKVGFRLPDVQSVAGAPMALHNVELPLILRRA